MFFFNVVTDAIENSFHHTIGKEKQSTIAKEKKTINYVTVVIKVPLENQWSNHKKIVVSIYSFK